MSPLLKPVPGCQILIWVFALVLPVVAAPRLDIILPVEHGLVSGADSISGTARLFTWDSDAHPLALRFSRADWMGGTQSLSTVDVVLKGQLAQAFQVPLPDYGPYVLRVEAWATNTATPVVMAERRVVRVVSVPRLTAAQRARSPIGVNAHQNSPWTTLGLMGIHWGRDYSWGWLGHGEHAPVANGANFMRIWETADAAGITILPVMMGAFNDPEHGKAFIQDPKVIADSYERLGRAFPDIPFWEVENEIDGPWQEAVRGVFNEAEYYAFMRHAASGLRAAGHGARIVPNGMAGIYTGQSARMLDAVGGDIDVINYHCYTGTRPPEHAVEDINFGGAEVAVAMEFTDRLREINRLAQAAGKEAWLTEIGWDVTYGPAVGERLQAMYLARVYLLARLSGTDKIFWFFDRDTPGTGKFASCGLIDLQGNARPSAAALAQVSHEIADGVMGGSVDLGEDRWCVVFRKPDQSWVAAVWSVAHTWPCPAELVNTPAFDLFGNATTVQRITPSVTYFHLDQLPAAWESQRQVAMESRRLVTVNPGASITLSVQGDTSFDAEWGTVPAGLAGRAWTRSGSVASGTLGCDADQPAGHYPVTLIAKGKGWMREWMVTVNVEPAVRVHAAAFVPGKTLPVALSAANGRGEQITAEVSPSAGRFSPAATNILSTPLTAIFDPAPTQLTPVPLVIRTAGGSEQTSWLRPAVLALAPAPPGVIVDGRLADWSPSNRLADHTLVANVTGFEPKLWLGWTGEGLCLAASIRVNALRSGDPASFWEWPGFEVFIDTGDGSAPQGPTAHQFWFTPVQEQGEWKLVPGEWKRSAAIPATIINDARCRTAMQWNGADAFTAEVFIPAQALGGHAPIPGATWRLAVALQDVMPLSDKREAAWPVLKSDGLLDGSPQWGWVRFVKEPVPTENSRRDLRKPVLQSLPP